MAASATTPALCWPSECEYQPVLKMHFSAGRNIALPKAFIYNLNPQLYIRYIIHRIQRQKWVGKNELDERMEKQSPWHLPLSIRTLPPSGCTFLIEFSPWLWQFWYLQSIKTRKTRWPQISLRATVLGGDRHRPAGTGAFGFSGCRRGGCGAWRVNCFPSQLNMQK